MKSNRIFFMVLFCCFALVLLTGDAYADDVLQTVKSKAAKFIHDLRPLIFILAGFGLIGFAFGAIFGKISWKWFANIAIGLFLVANVGLFIDYLATKSGAAGQYAQSLGYGKYLDSSGGYTATPGSSDNPQSQTVPESRGDEASDNSSSEDLDENCVPGTGTGCDTGSGESNNSETVANTKESCETVGGTWLGTECVIPEEENPDETPPPGTGFENENNNGNELNNTAEEGKDYSQEKQKCQTNGGTWNSSTMSCDYKEQAGEDSSTGSTENSAQMVNPDAAGDIGDLYNQISNGEPIEEETPEEAPLPGTGFENEPIEEETPEEAPLPGTDFENEYDIDGGMLDEVVVGGKDYSQEKQKCQITGGTWNSSTMSCDYEELKNLPTQNDIGGSQSSSLIANSDTVDTEEEQVANENENSQTENSQENFYEQTEGGIIEETEQNETFSSEEAENDAPLEDEAMTEVDCRSLELECKNKYAAALEACDAGTERMTQKEWCQKNPSKCAYESGEYDNMAKKPKDVEDYNKYIEEMYEEKRRCEEARLDTCHFDRTPSEETYCERYPSRCTEVKTGSTQYSGMYPTEEGMNDYRAYFMEVAQNKKNLEKCKEAAGDAAVKCYAACSKY